MASTMFGLGQSTAERQRHRLFTNSSKRESPLSTFPFIFRSVLFYGI